MNIVRIIAWSALATALALLAFTMVIGLGKLVSGPPDASHGDYPRLNPGFLRSAPSFEPPDYDQTKGKISYQPIADFRFAKKLFPPPSTVPRLLIAYGLSFFVFAFGLWLIERGKNISGGVVVICGGFCLSVLCWITVVAPIWLN